MTEGESLSHVALKTRLSLSTTNVAINKRAPRINSDIGRTRMWLSSLKSYKTTRQKMSTILDYYYSDLVKWRYMTTNKKTFYPEVSITSFNLISSSLLLLAVLCLIVTGILAGDPIKFQLQEKREALLSTTKLLS